MANTKQVDLVGQVVPAHQRVRRAGHVGRTALIIMMIFVGTDSVVFADEIQSVRLMVGRSVVVDTDWPIARLSLTSSDIADAMVTKPNQVLVQGKLPGTISMFLWDRGGAMLRYDVTVERDLSRLTQQIHDLFPGESISVEGNGKSIVIKGMVATKYVADKAVEVAAGWVDKKEDVVSLMQVADAGPPPQVLLRVRFAEVSRSALTELGVSLFTGAAGYKDFIGRTATQQFPAPVFDNENPNTPKLVFSDFLNLFLFDVKNQLGGVIKALQNKGLFQSLAEPNLVAESGKEASFLAGGEFPIPIAQGGAGNTAISVVFKEFGVRLNFTPTVTGGNRIRLKVRPEVSTLDFSNAIVLQGFRIPALSTRRTETEVELQDGQTFAIAGLLNNTATEQMQKIPGIGDIPILGLLFRSKAAQKNQTELVVMITPQILPRMSSGVTTELPRLNEPYLTPPPINRSFPTPPPAFTMPPPTSPRPDDAAAVAPSAPAATPTSNGSPTPREAAAVLMGREPKAPTMIKPTQPGEAPRPAAAATSSETRPMTADDRALMEKTGDGRKVQQAHERGMKELAKREAVQANIQKRHDQQQLKRQQQLAREQAKRDAVAAEKAKKDAARQAVIDQKLQKGIDEAAARVQAAEAAYQAELAKKGKS
jgi:pilus assembly protein CpaC